MKLVKKEKTLELLLWGVVAYAVTILTYFTFKAFGQGSDYISALGSLLSAAATFFAAYIAITLFNDWKVQHNKALERDSAFKALSVLEAQHFPFKILVGKILETRGFAKNGFTKFQETMYINIDPEFIEKLRYNIRSADSFSDKETTAPLLENYIEKFTLLRNQTLFYISVHNDSKKAMGLQSEHAPLIMGMCGNIGMLIPNSDHPNPYEQKSEEYNEAFEKLSEHLFQKGKA
ncbi:hypothetical protein [Acinetobacter radioresistens]|uniref:hypothetical protein n=1 Tax=Acinetobacter radioresistens TaxID=40216 RepID=UPI00125EDD3C|nr:hypothetical protein [Acinetobacter radioresistens]